MEFSEQRIGEQFQEETKYARSPHWPISSAKKSPPRPLQPSYPQLISLSQPPLDNGPNLWKVLLHRRSIREYRKAPLSLEELSSLLWATQGITAKASYPSYRTAPSAGALHPIDTYLVVNRVERLEPGMYFLRVQDFSLEVRNKGDFSRQISRAALDQEMARAAAVVFIWVAVIHRCRQKYRQRAYRYVYLDCGHLGQNLYLAATAMNLGCCGIAAFYDDEVNELIGVDGHEETAVYLATVGRKESSSNAGVQ